MSTYLYRSDCINGRVFETEDEVKRAKAAGWVDSPNAYKPLQSDNQPLQPARTGGLSHDESPDGSMQHVAGDKDTKGAHGKATRHESERALDDEHHEKRKGK